MHVSVLNHREKAEHTGKAEILMVKEEVLVVKEDILTAMEEIITKENVVKAVDSIVAHPIAIGRMC